MAVYSGEDVAFQMGDAASPEAFTAVGQVTGFTAPSKTVSMLKHFFIGSSAPTKTPTVIDIGEATFEVVFDPDNAQHVLINTAHLAKTLKNFKIVITGATKDELAFSGYITAFTQSGGSEAEITGSVTIDVTSITAWA